MVTRFIEKDTPTQVNSNLIGVLVQPGVTPPVPPVPPTPGEVVGFVGGFNLEKNIYADMLGWVTGEDYDYLEPCISSDPDYTYKEYVYYSAGNYAYRTDNYKTPSPRTVDGIDYYHIVPINEGCYETIPWSDSENVYYWESDGVYLVVEIDDNDNVSSTLDTLTDYFRPHSGYGARFGNCYVYNETGDLTEQGDYIYFCVDEFEIGYVNDHPATFLKWGGENISYSNIEFRYTGQIVEDYLYVLTTNDSNSPTNIVYIGIPADRISSYVGGSLTNEDGCDVQVNVTDTIEEGGDPGSPGQPSEPIPVDCSVSYSVDGSTWTVYGDNLTDDNNVIANIPRYMYLKFGQDVVITEE